jgi:class III poly(R)-hydroxyalkanoic acid synthase PhaE subunit
MTNPWFEAQRKFAENWSSTMQAPFAMHPFANGVSSPWQQSWEYWQNLFGQNRDPMRIFAEMQGTIEETARTTAEKMLASQMQGMQLMQQVTAAWQTLAQNALSGNEWQTVLSQYVEQMRSQSTETAEQWFSINASTSELWQQYLEQMQQLGQPWLQAWTNTAMQTPAQLGALFSQGLGGGNLANGAFSPVDIFAPYWDLFEQTVGRTINSPALGLSREYVAELATAFETWQQHRRAEFEFYAIVNEGGMRTFEALMQRLVQQAQQGNPIQTPRQLIDLWVEIGDTVLTELFRSERYSQAQANLVNSSMKLRLAQRTLLEDWLQLNDLPTRSELDEAHKTIHGLRQEVKALKKSLNGMKTEVAAVSTAQAAAQSATETEAAETSAPEKSENAAPKQSTGRSSKTKAASKSTGRKRSTRKATSATQTDAAAEAETSNPTTTDAPAEEEK